MRLSKYKNYSNSTVHPAASSASFAFALMALILNGILDFTSPAPKILTTSVRLIKPFTYKLSKVNSVMVYFSIK